MLIGQISNALLGTAARLNAQTSGSDPGPGGAPSALQQSCGSLAQYAVDEELLTRLVVSSRPSSRPYVALIIADLQAASGDSTSAAYEFEQWLVVNERVDAARLSDVDRYRRTWQRISTRLRMNAYLSELPPDEIGRGDLLTTEHAKTSEAVYQAIGERTLADIENGKDCGRLQADFLPIVIAYAQASNNLAYYAAIDDEEFQKCPNPGSRKSRFCPKSQPFLSQRAAPRGDPAHRVSPHAHLGASAAGDAAGRREAVRARRPGNQGPRPPDPADRGNNSGRGAGTDQGL